MVGPAASTVALADAVHVVVQVQVEVVDLVDLYHPLTCGGHGRYRGRAPLLRLVGVPVVVEANTARAHRRTRAVDRGALLPQGAVDVVGDMVMIGDAASVVIVTARMVAEEEEAEADRGIGGAIAEDLVPTKPKIRTRSRDRKFAPFARRRVLESP